MRAAPSAPKAGTRRVLARHETVVLTKAMTSTKFSLCVLPVRVLN